MPGREMEGDNRYRRKKAKAARDEGELPGERGETLGGSKQRRHVPEDEDHAEKLAAIRQGKQRVIRENRPEPKPGSRPAPED